MTGRTEQVMRDTFTKLKNEVSWSVNKWK
jgi:hypothetical protein